MDLRSRRTFLIEVGRSMIAASVGVAAASELGIASTCALQEPKRLLFGELEPLVDLMAETPADKLNAVLVVKLRTGTSLRDLVAAAALANARTFGGENYVGFHTMMALAPAYHMALALPAPRQPLPVLKVLYRNTNNIQQQGTPSREVLSPVAPGEIPAEQLGGEALRDAVRDKNLEKAERIFASLSRTSTRDAYNALLQMVQDATDVHRVVLPHRAWDLLDVIGSEHAHTLLRQSVHYCVQSESRSSDRYRQCRTLLPKVLGQHKLLGRSPGTRAPDDAWIERTSQIIFEGTPDGAADVVAAALAEGMDPVSVGETIALAANQLLLRDEGRPQKEAQQGKPAGSVHGDSIGVHACDSANAWRGMASTGNARNTYASLILGASQVAFDRTDRGGDFLHWKPYPRAEHLAEIVAKDAETLLRQADEAIRANDQAHACAAIHRYGELGHAHQAVFDLLRGYATSEDGALHAEKYFRTATEEFASSRPAFRWRHACALARVTASEFGQTAPGYSQACSLLKI